MKVIGTVGVGENASFFSVDEKGNVKLSRTCSEGLLEYNTTIDEMQKIIQEYRDGMKAIWRVRVLQNFTQTEEK